VVADEEKRCDSEDEAAKNDQSSWLAFAEEEDEQAAHAVIVENVAVPEQKAVKKAKEKQPAHAAVVERSGRPAGGFDVAGHQEDACTEEHGENGHEFKIGEIGRASCRE